jgi:cytochrome d ubiquinol oxidase subunit II
MTTVWFVFLSLMITVYVVLDGFDLGVGSLLLRLAASEDERAEMTEAIGPVWNGNEVWLIAAGGVLFLSFPVAYAAAFSGLYFGLILVLWLLLGRGLSLELRDQIDHPLWHTACDTVFGLASAALAFVFGVALGNVIRGVPLGADGYFHLPLFQILNWYALLVGLFGLVVLAQHGAAFVSWRAAGDLATRARRWQRWLLWATVVLALALIAPTHSVRARLFDALVDHPWRLVFPAIAVGGAVAIVVLRLGHRWTGLFVASAVMIVGLLSTVAAGLYPSILPAHQGKPHGLTIYNAGAGHYALSTAIVWWSIGISLALVYFTFAYRTLFRDGAAGAGSGAS